MIKKLMTKWKEEWWSKRESQLIYEFSGMESVVKSSLENSLKKIKQQEEDLETISSRLRIQEAECDETYRRVEERKLELSSKNEELLRTIRNIESQSSPSGVWIQSFTAGFQCAWGMMEPMMLEGMEHLKKSISDKAITDTLVRLNGNDKKDK